jgi:hypothetical protein
MDGTHLLLTLPARKQDQATRSAPSGTSASTSDSRTIQGAVEAQKTASGKLGGRRRTTILRRGAGGWFFAALVAAGLADMQAKERRARGEVRR